MRIANWIEVLAIVFLSAGAAGCGYDDNPPIMVAVSDTVGISASGGAADQGAELAVGFKGRKLALVPVSLNTATGQATIAIPKGANSFDTHSVLTTLTVDGAAVSPTASLEQVVAVGPAADNWAKGRSSQPPPWAN